MKRLAFFIVFTLAACFETGTLTATAQTESLNTGWDCQAQLNDMLSWANVKNPKTGKLEPSKGLAARDRAQMKPCFAGEKQWVLRETRCLNDGRDLKRHGRCWVLPQGVYATAVIWIYNRGIGNWNKSSLKRNINSGAYIIVPKQRP